MLSSATSPSTPLSATTDAFKQQLKIATVFLVCTLFVLSVSRVFILLFISDWQNTPTSEIMAVLITGIRFDLKLSAVCIILFSLLPSLAVFAVNRWRWALQVSRFSLLAILLSCLIFSFVDIGFYLFFGTAISNLIFGIIDDGTYAVMLSIISDWRLNLLILLASAGAFTISKYYLTLTKPPKSAIKSTLNKLLTLAIILVLICICALFGRGTLDTFPLSRRTTVINDNPTMNALALNAPYHFYYAYKDLKADNFASLTTQKILQQAKLNSLTALSTAAGFSSQQPLLTKSSDKGSDFKSPNVIFVLMEGWSSHIAKAHSEDNQVLGEFAQHALEDYFFQRFFSDKYGTNPTIEKLLLNAPLGPITQSVASSHRFALSNVLPFKQQGYQTLFLSGGNSAWRKHGQFWPHQGFDQYLGRATIEKHFAITSDNPWGVYDNYLFKFLEQQLRNSSSDKPLFSFVLTTNNHAPIKLPKDYQAPPLNPARYGFAVSDSKAHQSLTGFHFQSNALGEFITWLKQSKFADNTIVVATGDHVLKGFANYAAADQSYNRYAVASYLYVPKTLDQLKKSDQWLAGSHQDLFPTLFELALSNSQYFAFGTPIMDKTAQSAFGINDQGSTIFNQGVTTNNQQLQPFSAANSTHLSDTKLNLNPAQQQIVERQLFVELLQKYLLVEDFNKTD